MVSFGLTRRSAEVIGVEDRGSGKKLVRVLATGVSERAAKRSARLEATGSIPFRHQAIINTTLDRKLDRLNKRYIFTITDNPLEEGASASDY